MVNTKTHFKFTFKKVKYGIYGGQNRRNSIDYLYLLWCREPYFDTVVAIENNKTGKIEFSKPENLSEKLWLKVKSLINSIN